MQTEFMSSSMNKCLSGGSEYTGWGQAGGGERGVGPWLKHHQCFVIFFWSESGTVRVCQVSIHVRVVPVALSEG